MRFNWIEVNVDLIKTTLEKKWYTIPNVKEKVKYYIYNYWVKKEENLASLILSQYLKKERYSNLYEEYLNKWWKKDRSGFISSFKNNKSIDKILERENRTKTYKQEYNELKEKWLINVWYERYISKRKSMSVEEIINDPLGKMTRAEKAAMWWRACKKYTEPSQEYKEKVLKFYKRWKNKTDTAIAFWITTYYLNTYVLWKQ